MNEEKKRVKPIRIIGFVSLALFLLVAALIGTRYVLMRVKTASKPSIAVLAPLNDQTVLLGEVTPVRVHALANGQAVSSLEWYLDGALYGSLQGGQDSLSAEWQWLPEHEGTYQFAFLAYADNGAIGLASLDIAVLAGADIDADDVPDARDQCPSEPGPALSDGCPLPGDDDQDGLVGDADHCPDAFGPQEFSGCPAGRAPDSDGDGIYDANDRCPDERGFPDWDGCPLSAWSLNADGDELPDFLDECPSEYGPRDAGGCPLPSTGDADGDTVPDAEDACVDVPGLPANSGCPFEDDRDGDGIPDASDSCPDQAGLPTHGGCPPADTTTDLDLDAILDAFDSCPGKPGRLEFVGCPMPEDRDGDGIQDMEDHCPDLFGAFSSFGCPIVNFPFNQYRSQFNFLPLIGDFGEKGDDDYIILEPVVIASIRETSAFPSLPDDLDGDGVLDDEDDCDNQIGRPLNNGCPAEGDWDSDGRPDEIDTCEEFTGACQSADDISKLEASIVGYRADPSYTGIYCYGWSNGAAHNYRTPYWGHAQPVYIRPDGFFASIAYGFIRQDGYIALELNCWGQPADLSLPSQYLGQIRLAYPYFFWDGQIRKARSYGPGGMFEIWVVLQQMSYAITS